MCHQFRIALDESLSQNNRCKVAMWLCNVLVGLFYTIHVWAHVCVRVCSVVCCVRGLSVVINWLIPVRAHCQHAFRLPFGAFVSKWLLFSGVECVYRVMPWYTIYYAMSMNSTYFSSYNSSTFCSCIFGWLSIWPPIFFFLVRPTQHCHSFYYSHWNGIYLTHEVL